MTCIALSGYYGFYNTGDEAILEAIIGIVRRRLPGAELVVFSADPDHTRQEYGVESVSRTCLFSIFRTLHRADLLISGGGGLLQDVTSLRSVAYYL
ncbi:MAG: polysaccharide pyruvyl transferase family protein, partial [Dethiobacteria bacterium]